jgi:hypothetical protein
MTNILRDNKGNRDRIETCKYCTDYKGNPKPILPEDMSRAIRMPDGSYKCEPCQIEEIQNRIVKVTPNSESAKQIFAERAAKQKKDLEFKEWERKIKNMPGERYSFRYGAGLEKYERYPAWMSKVKRVASRDEKW